MACAEKCKIKTAWKIDEYQGGNNSNEDDTDYAMLQYGGIAFFYTQILDFEPKYKVIAVNDGVINLINGELEIQLSTFDGAERTPVNVRVDEVDKLFVKYLARGLDTTGKKDSPVHQSPLDQTWGMREFYVDDPDGNTLRFCTPIR